MYGHILVALDGSKPSQFAAQAALALAVATGARVTACHVYGAEIHRCRFSEMEPGLPAKYQDGETLSDLRIAHDRLIEEGFQALSAGYVENFVASAKEARIKVESIAAEGRGYVGILHLAETCRADLIILGANGLGAIGDGMLGGTTSRVLHSAPCDVLVARRSPDNGPILTGVDGSEQALKAVAKAVELGRIMKKPIHMIAAYDPGFHTRVFGVMARSLSPERQEAVGLDGQGKLHDEIINDGLARLYGEFLREAKERLSGNGLTITTSLVTGKPYQALDSQAESCNADLVVVSRHGHHRQGCSRLGSNAEGLLRTTSGNVLLVGGVNETPPDHKPVSHSVQMADSPAPLTWDSQAQDRLKRVPSFVRSMARRAVENSVRAMGKDRVSADDFDSVAARFGMGAPGGTP